MSIGMTKKELASLAGYTYRRLYDIDKSLPEDKKLFVQVTKEDGSRAERCDASLFVQRWVEYRLGGEKQDGSSDLNKVRAAHEEIKKRKTELEVEKMEGLMVPIAQVRTTWAQIAHTAVQSLMALPGRLAQRLVEMESAEAIGGIIEQEVRAVLTQLAENGESYAEQAEAEDAEEGEA